jgi:hypothetical protein
MNGFNNNTVTQQDFLQMENTFTYSLDNYSHC